VAPLSTDRSGVLTQPPRALRVLRVNVKSGLRKPGSGAAEAVTAISLEPPSRTVANDLPEDLSAGRAILLLGLPPGGVCRAAPLARGAVSSYLTVSSLPSLSGTSPSSSPAVCFLWHFPCSCERWALPTTLPWGARTFLPQQVLPAAVQRPDARHLSA